MLSERRDSSIGYMLLKRENKFYDENNKLISDHFRVQFEGKQNEEVLNRLIEYAEEAYSEIGDKLNFYPENKVTIFVFSPKNFYLASAVQRWAGACYDNGRLKLPLSYLVGDISQVKENIFHEYTHLCIDMKLSGAGKIPLWFNEGCAVNFSNGMRYEYEKMIKKYLASNKLLSFGLINQMFRSADPETATLAYAYSAYAIQYIIEEKGESAISEILEDVAEGENFSDAIYNVFFVNQKAFLKNFNEWLRKKFE